MSFHHPSLLWLLALPVIWCFWQWVRRGLPVVLPFDHAPNKDARWLGFFTNSAGLMPGFLFAIAILFLAGPRRPAPPKDEQVLNNIIVCVDVSGSMSMLFDGKRNRFEAAADAAKAFCRFRKGDAFGLTIFGSEYLHWVPPTRELSAVESALKYVRPDNMPPWMGGTLIANALRGCGDQLARQEDGDRAIILISDGGSADFADGGDRAVATELAERKVRVFSIIIGGDAGAESMDTISGMTGGKSFTAVDQSSLSGVFQEIDRMQKAHFKQTTADWVDNYTPFSLTGLAIVTITTLSLLGLRYTPW